MNNAAYARLLGWIDGRKLMASRIYWLSRQAAPFFHHDVLRLSLGIRSLKGSSHDRSRIVNRP